MPNKKLSIEPTLPIQARPRVKIVKRVVRKAVPVVPEQDENVPLERRNKQLLIGGSVIMILVFIVTGVLFYFRGTLVKGDVDSSLSVEVVDPGENPTPVVTSQPVLVEKLGREDISLEILNGSGIAGLASDTAEKFIDLGYLDIETGNTDLTDENALYVSSNYSEEELEDLLNDVEKEVGISQVLATLDDLETTARIVLGQE